MIKQQLIKIYHITEKIKTRSIAKISALLNIHRDTVKRRLKTLQSRENHPCSIAFETTPGQQWLQLLVILTIFYFGIKSNVGASVIAEFLTMLGVGLYLGVSSGSIKRIEQQIDKLIAQFDTEQSAILLPLAKEIDIHAGADETFFEQHNVLVFMDLISGFILKEEIQQKRTLAVWKNTVLKCITYFRSFKSLISDGSRVLKALSTDVLHSIHFSDLFHLLHYSSGVMRFQFSAKIKSLEKKISKTTDNVALIELEKNKQILVGGQHQFKQVLKNVSLAMHPFNINNNAAVSSNDVEKILFNSADALDEIKNNCQLSDKKKKLITFRNQLKGASPQINEWWGWTNKSLVHYQVSNELKHWLLSVLLPMIYWQQQLKKCRNISLKPFYEKALLAATQQHNYHILTTRYDNRQWTTWATWISSLFQRTTSAIEGRNGVLSLVSHFSRGLSKARLNSLTVIHNYHIRRDDNTTAAQRLFKTKHDSLLEYMVTNLVGFPMPRAYKIENHQEPLYLKIKTA